MSTWSDAESFSRTGSENLNIAALEMRKLKESKEEDKMVVEVGGRIYPGSRIGTGKEMEKGEVDECWEKTEGNSDTDDERKV